MARARAQYEIHAEDRTAGAINRARAGLRGLGDAAKGVGLVTAAGAGLAAAGLATLTTRALKVGDEIQKLALQTGLTTEYLSEMRYAAGLAGAQFESIPKAARRMSVFLDDVAAGGKTTTVAMARLGLSFKSLAGLSQDARLDAFIDALRRVEDPAQRAALANLVFGRAGEDMIRIAANSAEAIRAMRDEAQALGVSLSRDQVDAMAEANDAIARLQTAFEGLGFSLASEFAPDIARGAQAVTEVLLPALTGTLHTVRSLARTLGGHAAAVGAVLSGNFTEAADIIRATYGDLFADVGAGLDRLRGGADRAADVARGRGAGASAQPSRIDYVIPQLNETNKHLRDIANRVGPATAG